MTSVTTREIGWVWGLSLACWAAACIASMLVRM